MARVRVGVEWVGVFHLDVQGCREPYLRYAADVAEDFLMAMRSYGHEEIFDWGNDDAWSSDFDHPHFGGDSLSWSDDVHFCYFSGHGDQFHFDNKLAYNIGFSSLHNPPNLAPCRSMSPQWKLGAKRLKWFGIDSCQIVTDTVAGSDIVEVWSGPMQGAHLLLGFIGVQWVGPSTRNRRFSFGLDICRGIPIANAWLDNGFGWENPNEKPSRPIAIAAGFTRDEAISRREAETLDWLYYDVRATNWLAWKWRA